MQTAMAKTLLPDFRQRIAVAVSRGMSCWQAAARFGVSPTPDMNSNQAFDDEDWPISALALAGATVPGHCRGR